MGTLRASLIPALVAACWLALPVDAQPDDVAGHREETRTRFEQVASELEFIDLLGLIYNRPPDNRMGKERKDRYISLIRSVVPGAHEKSGDWHRLFPEYVDALDDVKELLDHTDPRVRTLAAIRIFHAERPHDLALIADLITDDESAVHVTQQRFGSAFRSNQEAVFKESLEQKTVGEIAATLLSVYNFRFLPGSDRRSPLKGTDAEKFESYWDLRHDREYCISWFHAGIKRRSVGHYSEEERIRRTASIRAEVHRLPPIDREVTVIALGGHSGAFSEEEVVFAARRLGPERLLGILDGVAMTDDPDYPRYRTQTQHRIIQFAERIFTREYADEIAERGRIKTSEALLYAAARVDPSRARNFLIEALAHSVNQFSYANLASMMMYWKEVIPDEDQLLFIDWFYDPRLDASTAGGRVRFLTELTQQFRDGDRELLAAIIRDDRFLRLGWRDLDALIRGLNQNLLTPIRTFEEERELRHPMGIGHFDRFLRNWDGEEHKEQTVHVMAVLDKWRERIRARISEIENFTG